MRAPPSIVQEMADSTLRMQHSFADVIRLDCSFKLTGKVDMPGAKKPALVAVLNQHAQARASSPLATELS